ncbi:MAG: bifunctional oligoribonuclease/PAP phosphatase NrnA, partial [Candidatus Omnitrophica bacterium]|nr:bifunctional oligoribonuclease/PAP phosphatase NrnA [Candidatus Omnitrophota bacterium]
MEKGLTASVLKTVRAIGTAKKVLVVCHINPDGDTIGCLLALGLSLIQVGKKVTLLSQDGIPARFQFLPGSDLVISESKESADVAIAVDCGSITQLGNTKHIFLKAKTTVQVDHHDFGQLFGKIQVIEEEASAVGEIVYELIRALGAKITPNIASCLLASIIIDTGSFRFSNIRPKTFQICGELVKTGINLQHLIEESYWKKSQSTARLSGYGLMKSEFSDDGALAWSAVTQQDFSRFKANLSDVDSVADDLRGVEGVKIAVLFRELPNGAFRTSLRSKYGINVANVAKLFGGGGHHNSAGCILKNFKTE